MIAMLICDAIRYFDSIIILNDTERKRSIRKGSQRPGKSSPDYTSNGHTLNTSYTLAYNGIGCGVNARARFERVKAIFGFRNENF